MQTIPFPSETRPDEGQQDRLRHSYPLAVMEGRWPVVGDLARCGYVKRAETRPPGRWGEAGVCVVCEELAALALR